MRKASYLYALVVLSACGSGGQGQPMLVDGGPGGGGGDAGDMGDAGVVVHCSHVMFATTAPLSYPTGLTPASVAVKDVNKDGKPDILVANEDDDTISVLLNTGNNKFTPGNALHLKMPSGPDAVAAVDVNKDGIPDVVVANRAGTVSVLLGDGHGAFTAKPDMTVNPALTALAVGDFDGDGKPDIVVASTGGLGGGTVSVLLGNGNGTFTAKPDLPTGGFPGAIALADVDKNGTLDIVVTSETDGSVSVLRGDGHGAFTSQPDDTYSVPSVETVMPMAVADLNHDGQPDIVVIDGQTNHAFVLLNKGDGSGTFQIQPMPPLVGEGPQGLAVADITGDGELDIVTVGFDTLAGFKAMSVLAGKGDGTFAGKVDSPVGSMPAALAVTDLNGDGVPDIVVVDQDSGSAMVLLAQCQP